MAVDHNNPQSRNEEILIATIDGNEYNKAPQSRIEELLLELKEVIEEGGGGGGTSDYENLSNQPQVNGETLIGDKSGADLGLVDAVEGKDLSTNDYDDNEKAAVAAATSAISAMKDGTDLDSFGDVEVALLDKADTADLGTAAAKDSTNAVTSGSTDLVESGAVKDAIDSAVSRAYHHAGTKTVAQLTHDLLIAANEGNVYEMTDSGTTTSDFMEGIGRPIKEGDNVGIARASEGVYKFDLLSGFVDTTNFVQKSQTAGLLKNDGTVNDEIEGDVDQLKSGLTDLTDHVDGDATTYPYADVITVEDAVPANLADCSVKVEPVQDLHGYDKPWVGGAGKNKLPLVLADLKTANATGTWADNVYTINGGTITVNTDDGGNVLSIVANGTFSPSIRFNLSYPLIGGFLNGCHTGGGWSKYVILQDGIGGDEGNGFSGAVNNVIVQIYINSGIQCDNLTFRPMVVDIAETDKSFAPYTNICPISGHTEAAVTVADDDTDPTVTNTYTLALGDTIYGCTVDFDSGVMTVTHGIVDLGSITWIYVASWHDTNLFYTGADVVGMKTTGRNAICSCYDIVSNFDFGDKRMYINNINISNNGNVGISNTDYTDAGDFKTAMTGQKLVYELATPFTVQLTPQQIQLLQGTNTLYASTGDISVTVNGVSGSIGQVQEQVNELRTDLSKGYLVKTFNVEGHANDTSIDFSALKPSDYNGFVNAYSCNGSGVVIQKCKNDVIYFVEALGIDATITIVYTVSQ